MHPPLQELVDELDRARTDLWTAWIAIPPAGRDRRPTPTAWSPAEIVEHLRLTESGSVALLAKRLQRARDAGLGPEHDHASRLRSMDAHDLTGPHAFEAPDLVRPGPDVRAADAEAGLRATRDALHAVLAAADGLALGEIRLRHARFGEIDFYQWLLFLAGHERRHARQLTRQLAAAAG